MVSRVGGEGLRMQFVRMQFVRMQFVRMELVVTHRGA